MMCILFIFWCKCVVILILAYIFINSIDFVWLFKVYLEKWILAYRYYYCNRIDLSGFSVLNIQILNLNSSFSVMVTINDEPHITLTFPHFLFKSIILICSYHNSIRFTKEMCEWLHNIRKKNWSHNMFKSKANEYIILKKTLCILAKWLTHHCTTLIFYNAYKIINIFQAQINR